MGWFYPDPPTFIGGAQPYAPPRKIVPPAGITPAGLVPFRSVALLAASLAAWQPVEACQQQRLHVIAPENASPSVRVPVLGWWQEQQLEPQPRRFVPIESLAVQEFIHYRPSTIGHWWWPEVQQPQTQIRVLPPEGIQPVLVPYPKPIASSWWKEEAAFRAHARVTPPAGFAEYLPFTRRQIEWPPAWAVQQKRLKVTPPAFVAPPSKALIVYGPTPALTDGHFIGIFGSEATFGNESRSQSQATEAATFSGLAWRATGGASGTNTLRFRKNTANGNQVASVVGPGFAEDTTNSDIVAATDLVNYSFAETGNNAAPVVFARCNVELASGHGNFHGISAPTGSINLNFAATRYLPLSGMLEAPQIAIAEAQWKNRGYTSCEAIQVRVISNARVNNTTFKLNVNGANVGAAITVGAGLTGLFTVTEMGQALADGDLYCIEWASGAGAEDFVVSLLGATLKSTTGASESWAHRLLGGGYTRTASATPNYLNIGGRLEPISTEENHRIKVGFATRARNLRTFIQTNTCTGEQTLKLFINGVARLTRTIAAGATGWEENETDTFDLNDTDEACLEIVGGTSGSCLFRSAGLTFSPISEVAEAALVLKPHRPLPSWFEPEQAQQERRKVTPPAGLPGADAPLFKDVWIYRVLSVWERDDRQPQTRSKVLPAAGVAAAEPILAQSRAILGVLTWWHAPGINQQPVRTLRVEPPFVPGPDSPPFPPYPIVAILDHWHPEPIPQHFPTRVIPPEGVPPVVVPPGPEPQPLVTGSGGKRKLPKKRRATICAHLECLKAQPVDLSREMAIARRNLQEIEALYELLNAQDRLLFERYRDIYLEYLLKQDDETIIMLAG